MLTRKHYKAIADIIKEEYTFYDNTGQDDTEGKLVVLSIAERLSRYFTTDNSQFNQQKFLDACGLN